MSLHFDFAPDPTRAEYLNRRMHRSLAHSLRHIGERTGDAYGFVAPALQPLIAALEAGISYEPATFSYYYDLVPSLIDADDDAVATLVDALVSAQPIPHRLRISALGSRELGARSERYHRLMGGDEDAEIGLLPPSAELAADFHARFTRGFTLLERAIPELAGEIRAIINEVVIVAGDRTKPMQFDGGSHFQLWGALFLNAEFHRTDYAVVEVIAHESAHSLLFGFCTDEALVENPDEELYTSPLRPDPRPMDGIYHATFVSARMHWAMSRLLASGMLDDEARDAALRAAAADAQNFEAGYATVREHGRLTATGHALMAGARAYMDTVSAS